MSKNIWVIARVGAGGDLAGEHVEVVLERGRLRVPFGVCRDRHLEAVGDGGDQIGRAVVAVGVGCVGGVDARRRIAAQGHDLGDAELLVALDHRVHVVDRLPDAREVRGHLDAAREHGVDRPEAAVAVGAAGAVGDRHVHGVGGTQPLGRVGELGEPVGGLRGEDLERHGEWEGAHRCSVPLLWSGEMVVPVVAST